MEKGFDVDEAQGGVVDRVTTENEDDVVIVGDEDEEVVSDVDNDSEPFSSDEDEEETSESEKFPSDDIQETSKTVQTAEENAKYAAARRAAEKKQREAEEKYRAVCLKYGIEDDDDIEPISTKREDIVAKAQKKGLYGEELDEYVEREEAREFRKMYEADKAREAVKSAQRAKAQADLDEFNAKYPNVDAQELLQDELFGVFKDAYLGKRPLVEVYEIYLAKSGKKAQSAAVKAERRAERSTATGQGGDKYVLTPSQAKMLKEWNTAYPDMKMSAKEFLSR